VFVAHNVDFDLAFLQNHFSKCHLNYSPDLSIDTVELSKIFLPAENSFQLAEITSTIGINLSNAHRADEDAYATAELFLYLLDKMSLNNCETIKRLYHLSKQLRDRLADLIFSLLSETKMEKPREDLKLYKDLYNRKSGSHEYKMPEGQVRELYDK